MSYSAAPVGLPMVEGVQLGRTVSLDRRAWQRHEGDTFFGLDQSELRITGQGYIQLDADNHVHRFYTDEEIMFQAVSRSADGSGADDITIFHGLWSHEPHTDPGRRHFIERIRKPFFEHEGVRWDRFWLQAYENDQDPVISPRMYSRISPAARRARWCRSACSTAASSRLAAPNCCWLWKSRRTMVRSCRN
jgi:hypothetical protein